MKGHIDTTLLVKNIKYFCKGWQAFYGEIGDIFLSALKIIVGVVLIVFVLMLLKQLYFEIIMLKRKRVYYQLIPPLKSQYRIAAWEEIYARLNTPPTPSLLFMLIGVPPDYTLTFSHKGVILSAPAQYKNHVERVLADKSENNSKFTYVFLGTSPPVQFKKVIIRYIRGKEQTDKGIEQLLFEQSIKQPDEVATSFQLEGEVQKDASVAFFTAAIKRQGQVQLAWLPVWRTTLLLYPWWRRLQKYDRNTDIVLARVRVEKEGPAIEQGFYDPGLGIEWGYPGVERLLLGYVWKRRANWFMFGSLLLEKAFFASSVILSRYFHLPLQLADNIAEEITVTDKEVTAIPEAATKIPWLEVDKYYIDDTDALVWYALPNAADKKQQYKEYYDNLRQSVIIVKERILHHNKLQTIQQLLEEYYIPLRYQRNTQIAGKLAQQIFALLSKDEVKEIAFPLVLFPQKPVEQASHDWYWYLYEAFTVAPDIFAKWHAGSILLAAALIKAMGKEKEYHVLFNEYLAYRQPTRVVIIQLLKDFYIYNTQKGRKKKGEA